mmetsp:Transcript_6163/g.18288  ORF Transcript_6163/g.18288 Transcript_6163/m.18288 type:complete len:230 (-) Transcript_6163:76-765(-)
MLMVPRNQLLRDRQGAVVSLEAAGILPQDEIHLDRDAAGRGVELEAAHVGAEDEHNRFPGHHAVHLFQVLPWSDCEIHCGGPDGVHQGDLRMRRLFHHSQRLVHTDEAGCLSVAVPLGVVHHACCVPNDFVVQPAEAPTEGTADVLQARPDLAEVLLALRHRLVAGGQGAGPARHAGAELGAQHLLGRAHHRVLPAQHLCFFLGVHSDLLVGEALDEAEALLLQGVAHH